MDDVTQLLTGCELPDGAIPESVIEICSYMTTTGDTRYATRHEGEVQLSTALGLLVLAGVNIYRHYFGMEET